MQVKITRATISEKQQVMPGQVLDVSKDEAVALIAAGKAVALPDAVQVATAPAGETADAPAPKLKDNKPKVTPNKPKSDKSVPSAGGSV